MTDRPIAAWVPSVPKAYETLCKIVQMEGLEVSAIKLALIMFEADRHSINDHWRPLYGEHWTASWSGPRPTILTQILAGDPMAFAMLDEEDLLDLRTATKPLQMCLRRPHDEKLAKTDIESLEIAVTKLEGMTDRDAVREYSQHELVIGAAGGTIHPRDMGYKPFDGKRILEMEAEMPYLYFGN